MSCDCAVHLCVDMTWGCPLCRCIVCGAWRMVHGASPLDAGWRADCKVRSSPRARDPLTRSGYVCFSCPSLQAVPRSTRQVNQPASQLGKSPRHGIRPSPHTSHHTSADEVAAISRIVYCALSLFLSGDVSRFISI